MTQAPAPGSWPDYPEGDVELAKIRYQAEVARQRLTAPAPPDPWPSYPPTDDAHGDMAKALYDVRLKQHTAEDDQFLELARLRHETDIALMRGYHETVRTVAKEAIGGADRLPQLVIGSAGAIITIYTGLLGLVFAAGGRALPARALIPALFLGGAIALATGYAAYLTKRRETEFATADTVWSNAAAYTNGFLAWVDAAIRARANLLRASVMALGIGLLFLPGAFVDFRTAPGADAAGDAQPATEWPTPASGDAAVQGELEQILFAAQVQETAERRAAGFESDQSPQSVELPFAPVPAMEAIAWTLAVLLGYVFVVRTATWKEQT